MGFLKLGLLGITVFAASGDVGAGSGCALGPTPPNAEYPASSPYVTAVGGTMFSSASVLNVNPMPSFCSTKRYTCAGPGVEVVCATPEALITSGGGFSEYTPMPKYQTTAVQAYLSTASLLPPSNQFNSSNRGKFSI